MNKIRKYTIKRVLLTSLAVCFAIGSLLYTKNNVEAAANMKSIENVQPQKGDVAGMEYRVGKQTKQDDNENTPVEAADESKEQETPATSKMKSGDTFTFGGRMWTIIDPSTGFVMMAEPIEKLELNDADFDKEDPNEILNYFDSTFFNEMSKEDQGLIPNKAFGLTYFEEKLHVTAQLDLEELSVKVEEKKDSKGEGAKKKESDSKSWWLILIEIIGVLIILVILLMIFKNKNSKAKDKENENK